MKFVEFSTLFLDVVVVAAKCVLVAYSVILAFPRQSSSKLDINPTKLREDKKDGVFSFRVISIDLQTLHFN